MKTLTPVLFSVALLFAACGDNTATDEQAEKKNDTASTTVSNNTNNNKTGSVNEIVVAYLKLKNSLAADDSKEAANAAGEMNTALNNFDGSPLSPEQKKLYDEVKDNMREHIEHIGTNSTNIGHQREHFDLLSKDMIDLVKETGSSQTLYLDFCPMYNNKKGASWLSESKEISNPYYGKEMLKCGEVKEEIKPKA